MSLPTLQLHPKKDQRIKQGHLWVYSNEINTQATPLTQCQAGDLVRIVDSKDKAIALATVNPNNVICARVLTRNDKQNINTKFFAGRIKQAQILRKKLYPTPHYRLVYGDSDFLPGVIIDQFGDYVVLQITTAGMEKFKAELVEAIEKVIQPKGILVANDHSARALENLDNYQESQGEMPEQWGVTENGVDFIIPGESGQKTGWFYDHRDNRQRVNQMAKDQSVLDVFSYIGGWGLQAAAHGASEVSCIDASEHALDFAELNADKLGVADKFTGYQGKATDVLKHLNEEKQKFDIVIVDPPAFIKRRKDLKPGLRAYKNINDLAIRLVKDGGTLVSASCSMHLESQTLVETVQSCASHNDRHAQLFYQGGQGGDHPIHPAIRETNYIKSQFYRILHR